jgi:Predicted membrane protein (DUF2254)
VSARWVAAGPNAVMSLLRASGGGVVKTVSRVGQWCRPSNRSLAGLSRRTRRQYDTVSRKGRFARALRRGWDRASQDALGPVVIWLAALLPAWSLPSTNALFGPDDLTEARSFLATMWQVEGATAGLTFVVVFFVFQAYSARAPSSLHQFAEETRLFLVLHATAAGLLLTGTVLLGFGTDAPGGTAAVWASVWAAVTLGLLVFLIARSLRSIDADVLHARRLERARRGVETEVDRVIHERIALALLQSHAAAANVDVNPLPLTHHRDAVTLRTGEQGRVIDIRLRPLFRLGKLAHELDLWRPVLHVRIGEAIGKDRGVLYVHRLLHSIRPRLRRIVRVSSSRPDLQFNDLLDELHTEALQLIRSGGPAAYDDIGEVYAEMLTALPTAWARYGQRLETDLGVAVDPFDLTFVDRLSRQLYDQAVEALRP